MLDKMRRGGQVRLEGVTVSPIIGHLTPDQHSTPPAARPLQAQPFNPPDRSEVLTVIPEALLEGLMVQENWSLFRPDSVCPEAIAR